MTDLGYRQPGVYSAGFAWRSLSVLSKSGSVDAVLLHQGKASAVVPPALSRELQRDVVIVAMPSNVRARVAPKPLASLPVVHVCLLVPSLQIRRFRPPHSVSNAQGDPLLLGFGASRASRASQPCQARGYDDGFRMMCVSLCVTAVGSESPKRAADVVTDKSRTIIA